MQVQMPMPVILNKKVLRMELNKMLDEFVSCYPERDFEESFTLQSRVFPCRLRIFGSCDLNVWRVPSGTVDDVIFALDRESAIRTAIWLISMVLGQEEGGVLRITDGAEYKLVMFRVFGRQRKKTIIKEIAKIRSWHFNSPRQLYRPSRKDRLLFELVHDDFRDRRNWLRATGDGRGILRLALTLLINAQKREHSRLTFGQARHQVPIDSDSCWLTINILGGETNHETNQDTHSLQS